MACICPSINKYYCCAWVYNTFTTQIAHFAISNPILPPFLTAKSPSRPLFPSFPFPIHQPCVCSPFQGYFENCARRASCCFDYNNFITKRVEKVSQKSLESEFKAIRRLGSGNSGNVYLYRKKGTIQDFALKKIKTNCPYKHSDALAEIQIMKQLDHPHILKIFKYYDQAFTLDQQKRWETGLLLELGVDSLQHCLLNRGEYVYDFGDIIRFIVKFIDLGAYLESQHIVHRDIKPGNIIIFGDRLNFKLADFGLSCNANEIPPGFAGTPRFCSPALKKYYNHGNRWQVANTDPYKDDVYSFALTTSEVIRFRFSLSECPEDVKVLLDEMLKQDQRERPTFAHLRCHQIVKKYLREENGEIGVQNGNNFKRVELAPAVEREAFTKKKIAEKEFTELNDHTEKQRNIKRVLSFNISKGVRTICPVDNFLLLCGTDQGQIFALDKATGQTMRLSLEYSHYISKIVMDNDQNVWIAAGNGRIQTITKQKLIECMRDCREIQPHKPSFFRPKKDTAKVKINIPIEYMQRIQEEGEQFVSQLYCLDQDHFAVGYCSGLVRVKWGKDELFRQYSNHFSPITSLVVTQDSLYSCDFSGVVKQYSLTKRIVEKCYYKFHEELISLSVQPLQHGQNLQGISCSGQVQTINLFKSCKTTFHAQMPVKNVISVAYGEKEYFLLTSDGQIYVKSNFLLKIEGRKQWNQSWMSLVFWGNELIAVSKEGEVCVVVLE